VLCADLVQFYTAYTADNRLNQKKARKLLEEMEKQATGMKKRGGFYPPPACNRGISPKDSFPL
jgi:hypothetical protein